MTKARAIQALGGNITVVAYTLGVSYQAVAKWPEELPERIADRVLAVFARKYLPDLTAELYEEPAEPAPNGL